jgi:serine protease SohB
VTGYGLAAQQLKRLRNAGFDVVVCVDEVAASGGYMMACVGKLS